MRIKDLKLIEQQYDDNSLIFIRLGMGTLYRLEKMIIKPASFDDDLTPIVMAEKCSITGSLVLKVE